MALFQNADARHKLLFFGVFAVVLGGSSVLRFLTETPVSTELAFWPITGLIVTLLLANTIRYWWIALVFFVGLSILVLTVVPSRVTVPPNLPIHMLAYFGAIVLCCWVLRRFHPDGMQLHRLSPDLRDFMLFVVGLSALLGITEALRVSLADGIPFDMAGIQRHFVSVATSIIVVAPAALTWLAPPKNARGLTGRNAVIEILVLFSGMAIVIAYGTARASAETAGIYDLPQLVLPFLIWAAVRFDYRVTSVTVFVAATYVSAQLAMGVGPFVRMSDDPAVQSLAAGWFLAGNGAAVLLLSSFVATTRRQASDGKRARAFLDQFKRAVHATYYEIDLRNWRYSYIEGALADRRAEYDRYMSDADAFIAWVHPDDRDRVGRHWEEMREGTLKESLDISYRYQPDGVGLVWVRSLVIPIFDDAGVVTGYTGITYDITEQEKLRFEQAKMREVLRESDKLHSLGALGAGLAHNWNNLLFILSAETDELAHRSGDDPETKVTIETLREVIEQGSGITSQLLGLARRDFGPFREVEPYDEISRAVELLRRSLPSMIDVVPPQPLDEDVTMKVKASYIHQIVLNLGLNARDAIGLNPGQVRFDLSGPHVGDLIGPDETFIRLTVRDSGTGIADDVKPRIFKALFTTKDENGGTGLGLAVVSSLVLDMGGTVDVESEQGEGSSFVVSLPVRRVVVPVD
ncbi:MAG: ATP-binding protein [Woeseiaceae bacterium]|nr:ATP-binding protein [Woeseiaceae bacterium]